MRNKQNLQLLQTFTNFKQFQKTEVSIGGELMNPIVLVICGYKEIEV